jgi:hydroxyacylglutathione hydrolase
MEYETLVVGALETNCYLAYCPDTRAAAVIDPGAEPEKIIHAIAELELKPTILINTHGHVDHVGANKDIKDKYDIPLCIHEADQKMLASVLQSGLSFLLGSKASPDADRFLRDGEILDIGHQQLEVIHTPGHSPGSISLKSNGLIFSGDTLFCGGVGRTDLPGGSWKELEKSINERILRFPDDVLILPGHGPSTTVGQERTDNPFLQ